MRKRERLTTVHRERKTEIVYIDCTDADRERLSTAHRQMKTDRDFIDCTNTKIVDCTDADSGT